VDENILFTFLSGDKAKTFGVIEPFDGTTFSLTHTTFLDLSYCFYSIWQALGGTELDYLYKTM